MTFKPARVLIIPGAGHSDDEGKHTRGHTIAKIGELEAIDLIIPTFAEELEIEGVPFAIAGTRKPPGIAEGLRFSSLEAGTVAVMVSVGWDGREGTHRELRDGANRSAAFATTPPSKELAQELDITMGVWGGLVDFKHITDPVKTTKRYKHALDVPMLGVKLEPFLLNWPGVDQYLTKLPSLGQMLGKTLARWMKIRNPSFGYHPQMVHEREGAKAAPRPLV